MNVHATCKWCVTFYHPQRCKWQNTGVTCPLYVICYTNVDIPIAMSGDALAYNFNRISLQTALLCSSWRHWFYKRCEHKFSQSKYSAEESTVGIEVSSPTNWLPLPSSSRGRKRGRIMSKDWTRHVQWVSVLACHTCAHTYWRREEWTDVVQRQ